MRLLGKTCISKLAYHNHLKSLHIQTKSEKSAYPKTFKGFQKKMNGILDIFTFIKHKKLSKIYRFTFKRIEDENYVIKNLQKQDKLVRWDKKK